MSFTPCLRLQPGCAMLFGIMKKLLLVISLLVSMTAAPVWAAEKNPLYEQLSRQKEVRVYVAAPVDGGATNLDPEAFRKAVEEALKNRKSIRFAPVASEAEAQYVVETNIKGFMFSLTDPVDMLAGVGMAAMDAAKVDHFASVDAEMTVREAKGPVSWKDTIHASITDETMTEEQARERIPARCAELFVRGAFGKNK